MPRAILFLLLVNTTIYYGTSWSPETQAVILIASIFVGLSILYGHAFAVEDETKGMPRAEVRRRKRLGLDIRPALNRRS